jgi:hypothetical protein
MTDVRFENTWHVFLRALDDECDKQLPRLLFERINNFKAEIRNEYNKQMVSLEASLETRSIQIKGALPFDGFRLDFDDAETGGRFQRSFSTEFLGPREAAADLVERLLETVENRDRHILDPTTGKLLCGQLERGRLTVTPQPTSPDQDGLQGTCPECLKRLGAPVGA